MNTQPKLGTRKLHKTALKTAAKFSVNKIPHTTNTADRTAAIQNTVGSILSLAGLCSTALLPLLPFGLPAYTKLTPKSSDTSSVPDSATRFKLARPSATLVGPLFSI